MGVESTTSKSQFQHQTKPLLDHKQRNVKSFPSHADPQGNDDICMIIYNYITIIWFRSSLPDTSLCCEITDTGLVYHMVCPFMPQLSLVLILPTHKGWPGWLTRVFFCIPIWFPARRQLAIHILTGLNVNWDPCPTAKAYQSISMVNLLWSHDMQVLQELIGNEKKFVSVMEELLDTYLTPLEANDSLYVQLYHHYYHHLYHHHQTHIWFVSPVAGSIIFYRNFFVHFSYFHASSITPGKIII